MVRPIQCLSDFDADILESTFINLLHKHSWSQVPYILEFAPQLSLFQLTLQQQ